jgi:hypothetical protein
VPKKELTAAQKRKLAEAKALMAEEGFVLKGKPEDRVEQSRQAEAILDYFRKPDRYLKKVCRTCSKMFLVNYPSVAECSDTCRKEHLRQIGIQWSPDKTQEERWAPSDVPLTIPPAALSLLISLATQASQQESHLALSS